MKRLAVVGSLALLPLLASCGTGLLSPSETKYEGTLYNSNDGICVTSGLAEDFYLDGRLVATIASGQKAFAELTAGRHTVRTLVTSTQEVINPGSDLEIEGRGWWYWCGCQDGTHPSSQAAVHLESRQPAGSGGPTGPEGEQP